MAYAIKGYGHQTFYELYQLVKTHATNPVKFNGVAQLGIVNNAQYFRPQVVASLSPKLAALSAASPQIPFSTVGLAQLINSPTAGLGLGMGTFKFDSGTNAETVVAYLAQRIESGGIANVGIAATMSKGVIRINQLSVQQDAAAVAQCLCHAIYDGVNAPIIFDDVGNLSNDPGSAVGPVAAEDELWTLGNVAIDNVNLKLVSGWAFTNRGFTALRTDGSVYDNFGFEDRGPAAFTISLLKPTTLADLGIAGIAGFGATGSAASTSAVFTLNRVDPNGVRKAAGDGDIVITANIGSVQANASAANLGSAAVTELTLFAHDDGANAPVTFVKNADA